MLLVIHIIFAIGSLSLMIAALVDRLFKLGAKPAVFAQGSAVAFAGLVATGTALVIETHAQILGVCLQGLLYFGCLSVVYVLYKRVAA